MELHLIDLNLLVALDALLRERNVTQAGVHLNLSQSAMSGALARLRSYFQDELLIPVGRRMVLTPLAETLVEPLRDVLTQIRGTLETKPRFEPATTARHMSIAASDYMIEVLLADVLRRARALAPSITFEFLPVGARACEALDLGELDFLIAPMHLSSAHPTEVLFEDTWTCIAWAENTSIGESLPLDDYLALGHVVVQIGDKIMYDEDTLRRFKYRRRVEVSVPSFSLAPHLVVGTDRIATVKTRLALKYQRVLPIRLLPLPFDIPPTVQTVQWHWVHEHHPSHRWFRCLLKEAIAALQPEEPRRPPSYGGARRNASTRQKRGRRRSVLTAGAR